jgi:hypothetical protein
MTNTYKKLGYTIAEAFGLIKERVATTPYHTIQREVRNERAREFNRTQRALPPNKRFQAGMTSQQKKLAADKYKTDTIQAGIEKV